MLFTENQR